MVEKSDNTIVLELPDGRTVLYDAGRMSGPTFCCRIVSGYLWSRGLTHIDAVVLSHADSDHYNALPLLTSNSRFTTMPVRGLIRQPEQAKL